MKSYSVSEINNFLKGTIIGSTTQNITAAEELTRAKLSHISFIGNKKYEKLWNNSEASIAVVNKNISIEPGENRAFIQVDDADLAMSQILELFASPMPEFFVDIHPTAVVDKRAKCGKGVKIGAGCYIGPRTEIGDGTIIYPNVTILDDCIIGKQTVIWSGVVIRERSKIGHQCIIHPNATIGADGFGFRPCPEKGLIKVLQIGDVIIGNQVEIGANACVDRGKFSSTIVGDGCKIDNLVQIGHNSELGMFCIMAGKSGLAGSVKLGNGVVIGGSASIKDHTTIGDRAVIGAGSGVTGDVEAGKTMLGYPALEARDTLKQWALLKRMLNDGKR